MESKKKWTATEIATEIVTEIATFTLLYPYLIPASISHPLFHLYFSTYEMHDIDRNKISSISAFLWPITLPCIGVLALFETVTGQMYKRIKLKKFHATPEYAEEVEQRRRAFKQKKEEDEQRRRAIIEQIKQQKKEKNYNESLKETVTCSKCKMDRPKNATYQMLIDSEYVYECNSDCLLSLI